MATGEILNAIWYAQPDDLIGGWCVTLTSKQEMTPVDGAIQIADFCREEIAVHVARLHNEWLKESDGSR